MIGIYLPGDSLLHRAPPGLKLLLLIAAGIGVVLLRQPWQLAVALALVLAGYAVAGFGAATLLRQIRPLWLLLAATFVLHVVISGWLRALLVVGSLVALVLLAALVSLTTRTSELVGVVERALAPLRRLRVDPERVGLAVALGIRCVPTVVALATELRDAQRARGGGLQLRGLAVAFVVRALRRADDVADALIARGVDDGGF